MKRYHIFSLLLVSGLLSVCPVVLSAPVTPADEGNAPVSSVKPEAIAVTCRAGEPVDVRLGCFSLSADSGSLLHDMDMHATVLPLGECAVLRSEMNNVTAGGEGVRLLPNGTHFSENSPARITLAYDPQRIPDNYGAEDIYTFCCEETGGQWYRLERIGIDTVAHTVTSLSTHFTDFANAIISLPELPESSAYVPTTLTDLPDPDPLQGIPMVQVNGLGSFGSPTGDNSGNASLTYPIVIPAGRHGLQPDVNLYYNSANGNGPLGVGWSIPMPAVTIDTRWGVPRYDALRETEAYLVNGEPIVRHGREGDVYVLPHQDYRFELRGQNTERFWFRDTRNATRVIRHGRFPTEYWWEVTSTSGITYYYGCTFDPYNHHNDTIDENSVLRDDNNNIGYWALTAVVDLDSNYILYQNMHSGNNIYPAFIHYTGNAQTNTTPTYKIDLTWRGRTDEFSDGRLGLLRVTDKLLCHIGILYKDTAIGAYYMYYDDCSAENLWKSRLTYIDKSDEPGTMRNCNYLEDVVPDSSEYAGSRTTFSYNNAPQHIFGQQQQMSSSSNGMSSSFSGGFNVGGTATVGIGFAPYMTNLSGGGNFDFSMDWGKMNCMLFDLNGDGLPDLVYQRGNTVKYRRQNSNMDGFGNEVTVSGLTCLSREVSHTISWGLQLSFVGHVHYSQPTTKSHTDYFFADINADGLPDMVTPDGILFNHLTPTGDPSFTPYTGSAVVQQHNSGCSEAGIHYTGSVHERLECEVHEIAVDSMAIGDLHDNGWTEPNDFHPEYYHEDGELQASHWNPLPTGNAKGSMHNGNDDVAYKGIIDRTNETYSMSNESPKVESISDAKANRSHPTIRPGFYEDGYTYHIKRGKIIKYGIETICKDDNLDPLIETARVWVAEHSGIVQSINSVVKLRKDSSLSRQQSRKVDGVRCIIQRNESNQRDGSHFTSTHAIILHVDSIAADDYTPKSFLSSSFPVVAGDILLFRLRAGDNSTFDDVDWDITINYSDSEGLHQANAAQDYICTGERPFVAPQAGEAIVRYKADNNHSVPIILSFHGSNELPDTLLGNSSTGGNYIEYDTIVVHEGDSILPIIATVNTIWSRVHIFPEIEYHWKHPAGITTDSIIDTTFFYPDVNYPCTTINTDSVYRFLFGRLHKGWGRFAYRPRSDSNILDLCSLINTEREASLRAAQNNSSLNTYALPTDSSYYAQHLTTITDSLINAQQLYNPLKDTTTWIPIWPDSRTERWIPYGNMGYICKTGQSNSRDLYFAQQTNQLTRHMQRYGVNALDTIPYYDSAIPVSNNPTDGKNKFVLKSTKSVHHCLSFGIPFVSSFNTDGTYSVITDFIDLNGDGFPDAVGPSGVQYTMPWGGLGDLMPAGIEGYHSSNSSTGVNFSASPDLIKSLMTNSVNSPGFTLDGSGGGAGYNRGDDYTDRAFVDMNGDGLPDIVSVIAHTVRYNLGYKFTSPLPLPTATAFNVSTGYSHNASLGGSVSGDMLSNLSEAMIQAMQDELPSNEFAIEQYSISGGVDLSAHFNITNDQLRDVNGDGLPDIVRRGTNDALYVSYNRGSAFSPFTNINLQTSPINSISIKTGLNASATLGIACGMYKICFGIGAGGSGTWTFNRSEMIDMNADGLPDHVIYDGDMIKVRYNQTANTNLLTCVTNPTGQRIRLSYNLSSPTQQHRQRQWVLDSIMDIDVMNPWIDRQEVLTRRFYDSAFYDNHERTDYGYARVITNESSIRFIDERYSNQSYIRRSNKTEDVIVDDQDKKYIGHRYTHDYCRDNEIEDWACDDNKLYACGEATYTDYYERQASPQITTRVRMRYDINHNLVEYYDDGDLAVSGDEWYRTVTYMPTTYKNLVALPIADSVMFGGGHLLRLRYATWLNTGRLHQLRVEDPDTHVSAMTSLFYDNFGNLVHYRLPMNENGERANYGVLYDYDLNALPMKIYNQFCELRIISYNPRWGLPVRVIDPDGAEITYQYDYMGRLTQVLAPKERNAYMLNGWYPHDDDKLPYTVRYSYTNINHNLANLTRWTLDHTYVTKEMITEHEIMPMTEVTIYSARGEQLQKKKRTEVNGSIVNLTNGVLDIDALGRVNRFMYPTVSSMALWEYDDGGSSTGGHPTFHWYDVLDRNVLTQLPDGELINTYYNITPDCNNALRFAKSIKDPLYNMTTTYTSPQGWTTSTEMADGSTTCYDYNCIGELIQVTDADSFQTTYTYNGFGQQIERNHPDAGVTRWRYDATGNLVCSRTQKQYDINDSTTYHYYFGRLMEIHHTLHPWENVFINYDKAGRLALREDRTGSERLWYDEFGNVRQTSKRIITPADQVAFCFMTRYNYDSFGRIREITYPDGENVNYSYYVDGGNLYQVQGAQVKVTDIRHDELEHITQKDYLNGCVTHYGYNPDRQWLTHIKTTSVNDGNTIFQYLSYDYDAVGNIINIGQEQNQWHGMGGTYRDNYFYDNRYRLAQNLHDDGYTGTTLYDMTYSPTSRIGNKLSNNPALGLPDLAYAYDNSGLTHQPRVIYNRHTETRLQLYWDRNGNLRQIQPTDMYTRFHLWDDDNKLLLSVGSISSGYYGNASDGKRAYKLFGDFCISDRNGGEIYGNAFFDNAVLYPNQYMTIARKDGYTKHYFMGTERFCTTIGGGNNGNWLIYPIDDLTSREKDILMDLEDSYTYQHDYYDCYDYPQPQSHTINTDYTGTITQGDVHYPDYQYDKEENYYGDIGLFFKGASLEEDVYKYYHSDNGDNPYYYHSDHLGSAAWITDNNGLPAQYLMYAPYGEQLLNQQSTTTYNERFTFTGKERDKETGYVHFDARNLFEVASIWLSPDPLLDKYIYNSPYAYCSGNPICKIDVDGRDEHEITWNPRKHIFKIKTIKNKKFDQFHIMGLDGKRFASSKQFAYGTITKRRNEIGKNGTHYLFEVFGDQNAEEILSFFGKNFTQSNKMPLEWTRAAVGMSNSGRNIIGTSLKESATGVGIHLLNRGYTLRRVDHNHPNGTAPSDADIDNAIKYQKKFPNIDLYYFDGNTYHQYDKDTPRPVYDGGLLMEQDIIVQGNK